MIDGFDTLILAFIAPLIAKAFGLSPPERGWASKARTALSLRRRLWLDPNR
jgi:hypothetical protein